MRRSAAAFALVLLGGVARGDASVPPVARPCTIAVDAGGQLDLACLPALSADGTRVAVPERCDDRRGSPCLAIALVSAGGKVRERVEIARGSVIAAQLGRVNRLLADERFAPMTALELPFSARDLNVMSLRAGGVVIRYGAGTLLVDRGDHRLARLGTCRRPAFVPARGSARALFLDEKTHTLAVEFGNITSRRPARRRRRPRGESSASSFGRAAAAPRRACAKTPHGRRR